MSVADSTDEANGALWRAARSDNSQKAQTEVSAAQVHALLAVAAAIQELAEATRR